MNVSDSARDSRKFHLCAKDSFVRRTLLTLILKSTLVTFKVEGLVISLFYGEGVELLVDGVCSSTVNTVIFARVVSSRNFAMMMFC